MTIFGRLWREPAWIVTGLPVALVAVCCVALPLVLGGVLAVIVVGVPILAAALAVARAFAELERRRARVVLGVTVERPAPATGVRDTDGWRAVLYWLLHLPVTVLGTVVALLGWTLALGALTYPLWFRAQAAYIDETALVRPGQVATVAAVGLAAVLLMPWVVRLLLLADRALLTLLSPSPAARRMRELAAGRARAVSDSADTLRRIERDLHDGAQARMVAIAIDLGVARDMLGPGPALEVVDLAFANTHAAIAELRDLARGIRPAALDDGLDTALATLTARAPLPVALDVDPAVRPSPPIAATVYFCAAELLTNALKHSGATEVSIRVQPSRAGLRLTVRDDGAGGVGGLPGLAERVGTVDGRLTVDSPPGGPTVVTVEVPAHE